MSTPRKSKPKPRRRGSITKLKSGKFFARLRMPADPVTGKRAGGGKAFDSKPEAEQWLAEEQLRLERGQSIGNGSTMVLAEFLRDFYTNVRKTTKGDGVLSPATCQADLELLELYIMRRAPGIAATPLGKLLHPPLRKHFQQLSESGLAHATVSRVHRTLRARLAYAVAEGLIRFNPMADARIPVSGKKKRNRAILSVEQAAALFAVSHHSRIGTFVATLLWTGLRPGEAAGLTWGDVNLERRTLHIRRALVRLKPTEAQRGTGDSWLLSTTKTGTERFVPVPDVLVTMLRRHRGEQVEARLAAGSEYEKHDLVFATPFGKPYNLDSMGGEYLKPLLRRAAVHLAGMDPLPMPEPTRGQAWKNALAARRKQEDEAIEATAFPMAVSWYSLRHSFATRLDQLRVPIKDIQELLGHANVTTTLTSYIHGNEQTRRNALDTLEDALLPKSGKLGIA